jgi:hypothetical protein
MNVPFIRVKKSQAVQAADSPLQTDQDNTEEFNGY